MTVEYENQTAWWTLGNRPGQCLSLGDEEFARIADEVTAPTLWDRCRSDLHTLLLHNHIWTEPGRFPKACSSYDEKQFAEATLQAWNWLASEGRMNDYWESVGTPTSRPSDWRDDPVYRQPSPEDT